MSSGVHGALLRSVAMERLFSETTMAGAGGLSRLTHLHSRVYTSSALPPSPPSHRNESSEAHTPLLDFSNTEAAYRTKTFKEILRAFFVYHTFSFNTLVTHSQKLTKLCQRLLRPRLFDSVMKATLYGQFVAGENQEDIKPAIRRLTKEGVSAILDYAVEEDISQKEGVVMEARLKDSVNSLPSPTDVKLYPQFKPSRSPGSVTVKASGRTYFYDDEKKCDEVTDQFLSCIETAAKVTDEGEAFAAIKLTGLGRPAFLLRLSEVVEGSHKTFLSLADSEDIVKALITPESFHRGLRGWGLDVASSEADRLFMELDADDKGRLDVFQWNHHFQPHTELHELLRRQEGSETHPRLAVMSDSENEQMTSVVRRAQKLAECAQEKGVRLMVDAEQTYLQPAIRHIAVNILMPKFNLLQPVIFTTVQAYLKRAPTNLRLDLAFSKTSGFCYGVKLVRGAYMEQERALAEEKGYEDPVWPKKGETDECYHGLLRMMLESVEERRVQVMVATHNEETVQNAIQMMNTYGINKSTRCVVFGQLLGMCDHVTFQLGQAGYGAYKYMPYGRVGEVIPYLLRRANENKGMLRGADRERQLIRKEMWRRIGSRLWKRT